MTDWKKKIDEKERLEKGSSLTDVQLELQARRKREFPERLRLLQSKFKCHICGVLPTRPARTNFVKDWDGNESSDEDWSEPGNLHKCSICHEWTCSTHLYKGICQICGEKL